MRIVFFGTPELAVPSLKALAARHEVVALVCQPDRPKGRSGKPAPPPAKLAAVELGIEVHQPVKLNDGAFEAWLRERRPELCALAAYGRILKQPILDVPPKGFLNVHPSLLPKYRGPSPIQSAILNGETETGVTIMRLSLEMDSGDILLQRRVAIEPDDTTATLTDRLAEMGADMLVEAVELLETGRAVFTPQDHARATYCKRFEKSDGAIHWAGPARELHNLVRAAVPWPVAYCRFRGATLRIHQTEVLDAPPGAAPGTVVRVEKDLLAVAAGDGLLSIRVLQLPGKRAMPAAEFLRGHPIRPGERFEDG